ncbi:30S ribosomal protein S14 [Kribbella speibonae]|uniref:Small ribosomal subunit protein uS14 n=1 Tax=Kribbella speibonae TaxID=1572660 RepID=A0A4R0J4Z2_9ACTN|nr:30S ribosomal protein S14 [Kribbella speibonae]TCC20817.1 30S ribosomal protein S14 [Kribbella speibonae]TCC40817.1 30S ribosomal protein S14 [Kribbella speibonae]
MATTAKIARNNHRRRTAAKYADRRATLKATIANPATSSEDRAEAVLKLQKLPRDASPTRIRNRDTTDGRPRGYIGKAGLSRITFRQLAHRGELPGITKSSW